jgi:hypothetical protein
MGLLSGAAQSLDALSIAERGGFCQGVLHDQFLCEMGAMNQR